MLVIKFGWKRWLSPVNGNERNYKRFTANTLTAADSVFSTSNNFYTMYLKPGVFFYGNVQLSHYDKFALF